MSDSGDSKGSTNPRLVRVTPICPRCGYVDPICWRRNRWINGVDYARFEDFIQEYPQFSAMIKGEITSDILFYYMRGKKANFLVYRWPKVLGPTYYTRSRHYIERHVPRGHLPKQQSKLTVAVSMTREASV
jgi:hypothetical protein